MATAAAHSGICCFVSFQLRPFNIPKNSRCSSTVMLEKEGGRREDRGRTREGGKEGRREGRREERKEGGGRL